MNDQPGVGPTDAATAALLTRFVQQVRSFLPVIVVWAHGSLAAGDYQPGRSDLDLVTVVGTAVTEAQQQRLQSMHDGLIKQTKLGALLHCSYVHAATLAKVDHQHLTSAHQQLLHRPLSPVTRRELLAGGLVLSGRAPGGLVPAVTDAELAEFVRADLRDYWRPATDRRRRWLRNVWVDLGLLTLARASVTLSDGRLISKREALEVLVRLDAPAALVADIRQRRYGPFRRASPWWRLSQSTASSGSRTRSAAPSSASSPLSK